MTARTSGEMGKPKPFPRCFPNSATDRATQHSQVRDFTGERDGRREWDRTTDHHHVKVMLYH